MDFHYTAKRHPVTSYTGDQTIAVTISGDNTLNLSAADARSLASNLTYHADLLDKAVREGASE